MGSRKRETCRIIFASGGVAHMVTDTGLDWAFLGMPNGDIAAYDLDRESSPSSAFRISGVRETLGPEE